MPARTVPRQVRDPERPLRRPSAAQCRSRAWTAGRPRRPIPKHDGRDLPAPVRRDGDRPGLIRLGSSRRRGRPASARRGRRSPVRPGRDPTGPGSRRPAGPRSPRRRWPGRDRHPARHLDDRQERVDAPEVLGRDGHADDRHDRLCGEHPRQVRRSPAPAMITRSPARRALRVAIEQVGVRWAETTRSSSAIPSSVATRPPSQGWGGATAATDHADGHVPGRRAHLLPLGPGEASPRRRRLELLDVVPAGSRSATASAARGARHPPPRPRRRSRTSPGAGPRDRPRVRPTGRPWCRGFDELEPEDVAASCSGSGRITFGRSRSR